MFEELDKLIIFIQDTYNDLLNKWKKSNSFNLINLKKTEVKEILNNKEIMNIVLDYRNFINDGNLNLQKAFFDLKLKNELNARVKAQNSIEYKINNYIKNHENGKVPLNKCLNDIYGVRIIFDEDVNYEKIKSFIKSKYGDKLKCINSSKKEGYVATHIYFKNDNYSFPWELQIWDKKHETFNIFSHEIYKQDYTKWEKENEGGE